MLQKVRFILFLTLFFTLPVACGGPASTPISTPAIARHPGPVNFSFINPDPDLPEKYDPTSQDPFQNDYRSANLTKLDLSQSLEGLLFSDFDSKTTWPSPDRMPAGFDPQKIMEIGKNPGLEMRRLHEQGITGKGVGIAIIDQPLLVDHQEYSERVRLYEEIDGPSGSAAMHGAAVASIAVGKTVGVAPEASLYFIEAFSGKCFNMPTLYHCLAQAVRRILQVNTQLASAEKIRVISIARGYMPGEDGSDDWKASMLEAKSAGLLVVSSSIEDVFGFKFHALGRTPLADPDQFTSYEPGSWWADRLFYRKYVLGPPACADGFTDDCQSDRSERLCFLSSRGLELVHPLYCRNVRACLPGGSQYHAGALLGIGNGNRPNCDNQSRGEELFSRAHIGSGGAHHSIEKVIPKEGYAQLP